MKLIGLILIVIACFGVGYYLSLRLKNRFEFLSAFKDFLSNLETNIRYNSSEIFSLVKFSAPGCIRDIFTENNSENFTTYWSECISKLPKRFALKKDDLNLLYEFGRMLGTTDTEGEINHIKLYKELIESNINNSEKELKQKSKLMKLLGLFAGLSLALLLL